AGKCSDLQGDPRRRIFSDTVVLHDRAAAAGSKTRFLLPYLFWTNDRAIRPDSMETRTFQAVSALNHRGLPRHL
ncbi:hypothetical protein, partial [Sinorhizobium medicae]|uniref:hypothetical protein n=1 Tax=Sinorhizobium medicae TaxID=110321 RepID=UPI001AED063E